MTTVTTETTARPRTDAALQEKVQEELRWDSHISDAAAIGVAVTKGTVTLSGLVPTFAEKMAAQDAAHRIVGVRDVANTITVAYPGHMSKTDADIAQAVRSALEWDTLIPEQNILSSVMDGWVTLEGRVPRLAHRNDAERAIRNLVGVRGVTNRIVVVLDRPVSEPAAIRTAIEAALERQTAREVSRLHVALEEGDVILSGTVRSWAEKLAAGFAAASTHGVRHVENRLVVDPYL